MNRKVYANVAQLCCLAVLVVCCNKKGESDADTTGGDPGTDVNTGTGTGVDTAVPNTVDPNELPDRSADTDSEEVCVSLDLTVEQLPVRVMILQDRSTSMNDYIGDASKWQWAEAAVEGMVTEFDAEIEFGLDFFPFGTARCDVPTAVISDTLPQNGAAIQTLMETHTTPPRSLGTPLSLALTNYTSPEYAPLFSAVTRESYLVVISDGSDTCGTDGRTMNADLASNLAETTTRLLDEQRIRTFVIGFGDADVYDRTGGIDVDQLNAIAANGGTPYKTYINAQDGIALQETLQDIAESVHISCAFEVGEYDPFEVDMNLVNIYFDKGVDPVTGASTGAVGRDDGCASGVGWTWMDEERTAIMFCEQACNTLQQQSVGEIAVEIMCNPHQVVVI